LRWAENLEADEDKQCRRGLRVGDEYCALGLLCELHRKETGEGQWVHTLEDAWEYRAGIVTKAMFPPVMVFKWADCGSDKDLHFLEEVAQRNDNGDGFGLIAKKIKEYVNDA
jgi:hypothetical protein